MRVEFRGYEGVMSRMQEIESKLRSVTGEQNAPGSFDNALGSAASMAGKIGNVNGFAPLSPTSEQLVRVSPENDKAQLRALAGSIAGEHGLDPVLFESLVNAESGFNPNATSSKGALGLTQLMPNTARGLNITDPMDPEQNLRGGARYLAGLMKRYGGREELALAAYNAGPGNVDKYRGVPPFPETVAYVRRIMGRGKGTL